MRMTPFGRADILKLWKNHLGLRRRKFKRKWTPLHQSPSRLPLCSGLSARKKPHVQT